MRKLQEGVWLDDAVINFYIRVCLREHDKELCHINGNKQLHFFSMQFISLMWNDRLKNKADKWKMEYNNVEKWSKNVPGGKLFKLKYVFCPINFENKHWACAVILMGKKHIKYYDSVNHAYTKWRKMKNKPFVPDILAGLVEYLKREAEKVDKVILPDKEWTIAIMAETPFQKNGSNCGIFVCVLCNLYSKDCPIKFKEDDLLHCHRKIGFSIMQAKAMLTDHGEEVEKNIDCVTDRPEIASHLTWTRGTKQHVRIPDFELSKICNENSGCYYECNDNCDGKDKCNNKRIRRKQWKNVMERDSGNQKKGFSLFLEEGCRKDDFIIVYTGKVTKKHGGNYSMKINTPEFKGKRKKGVDRVYINANIDGGLAKYINHSCNPNYKLIQWYVNGLPCLCFFCKKRNQERYRTNVQLQLGKGEEKN